MADFPVTDEAGLRSAVGSATSGDTITVFAGTLDVAGVGSITLPNGVELRGATVGVSRIDFSENSGTQRDLISCGSNNTISDLILSYSGGPNYDFTKLGYFTTDYGNPSEFPGVFVYQNSQTVGVHFDDKVYMVDGGDGLTMTNVACHGGTLSHLRLNNKDNVLCTNCLFQHSRYAVQIFTPTDRNTENVRFVDCWWMWVNGEGIKILRNDNDAGPLHGFVFDRTNGPFMDRCHFYMITRDAFDSAFGGFKNGWIRDCEFWGGAGVEFKNGWTRADQVNGGTHNANDGWEDSSARDILCEGNLFVDCRSAFSTVNLDENQVITWTAGNGSGVTDFSRWTPQNIDMNNTIYHCVNSQFMNDYQFGGFGNAADHRILFDKGGENLAFNTLTVRRAASYLYGPASNFDIQDTDFFDNDGAAPTGWSPAEPLTTTGVTYDEAATDPVFVQYAQAGASVTVTPMRTATLTMGV